MLTCVVVWGLENLLRVAIGNFEEAGSFEGETVEESCSWGGLAREAFVTEE